MPNARRGEIEIVLGGRKRRLCLTFGALAALESRVATGDLASLAMRFTETRVSAQDLLALLLAGLEGAGDPMSEDELRALDLSENWTSLLEAAAALLTMTFNTQKGGTSSPLSPQT